MAVAAAVAAAAVVDVVAAVTDRICSNANRLLLQFHITGRCNLRCKHCYRTEGDVQPLSTQDVFRVLEQFEQLRRSYNQKHGFRKRGHINITGGEPFIREDIDEILDYLGSHREQYSFGVLSNGSFLNEDRIRRLKENGVAFVQLSIDGDPQIHDSLRAPGDYDRVFQTAKKLERSGIRTYISFTANGKNFAYLPQVAAQCRRYGITKLWTDRLVPIGTGERLEDLAITGNVMPQYLKALKKAQGNFLTRLLYPKTQVTANRALQFLGAEGNIYSCSAGNSLITVDEFGNVMPCRRMPIVCGNIQDATLEDIYFGSETFLRLRKRDIPRECAGCVYSYDCRGGARCQSYAAFGSFCRRDPGCYLIQGKLEDGSSVPRQKEKFL